MEYTKAVAKEDFFMRSVLAAVLSCFLATPVVAEELLVDYYSLLGPADAVNSRGAPLDDLCAIVQQDRANWHRFKIREQYDGGDLYFDSTERRAAMAGKCEFDRSYFANPGQRIRSGERSFYVYVRVFGSGGQISRVLIAEGAG